jgi:hypothetical protein
LECTKRYKDPPPACQKLAACRSPSFNPPPASVGRRHFYSNFDWLGCTNHVPPPRLADELRTSQGSIRRVVTYNPNQHFGVGPWGGQRSQHVVLARSRNLWPTAQCSPKLLEHRKHFRCLAECLNITCQAKPSMVVVDKL